MSKNILMIDSDKELVDINKKALESQGFQVKTLGTAKEALEYLTTSKPDLILTEIMLENKDSGFSLCYSVKKRYPDVPIVILSDVVRNTGISFGLNTKDEKNWIKADEFIHKPVSAAYLVNKVAKHL